MRSCYNYLQSFGVALLLLVMGTGLGAKPVHAQERGTVLVTVIDAETKAPIERTNVVLRRGGETWGASTDAEGVATFTVPAGTYRVTVSAVGYAEGRQRVRVEQDGRVATTLSLSPKPYTLNAIVVQDERDEPTQSPTTVQRIDPQAIERQDAADVSELASIIPATHVQTNSRGQTILYFRNAGDRQVGQFFDGALLNIPWDNRVDISLIPASVVEEVTVTKGVPSVRYGANVLGGAINFQSRTLDAPGRRTEIRGALGTAEQRRASVTHLGRTQHWDYTVALQYTSRGDQPLPADADLKFNQPFDDRRINTDRQLLSGFGRASYRFDNGGQLGLSVLHVDAEQGVAPEGNKRPAGTRYWRYPLWQKSTIIASGQTPLGTNTSLRGAAWGSRFARDIADYKSIAYQDLNQIQEGRDLTGGVRLIATQNLSLGSLTLALNGLTSRHEKTTVRAPRAPVDSSSTSTYRQHIFSTGLEYKAQVHPRVTISVGTNLDGAAYPETGPFPERSPFYAWGVTSGISVDVAEGWTLRGATGRKSRFPTMRELFGAAIGKFVPNPGLQPVTAWIGEIGLERQGDGWSIGLTPFYNRVYNTIGKTNVQTSSGQKVKRINLRGARIYGIETTARWTPTDAFTLDGNVTWSRPRSFTDEGTQKLDEKPGWLATGIVTYTTPFGLSLTGQARYTGNVYVRLDRPQGRAFGELSPSLVLDARLSYELPSVTDWLQGRVYVRGENLTDEAAFIGLGLPRPGRSVRVGLDLTL